MMPYVVNRPGGLAGKTFDVMEGLFVDLGVVPNFLLMVSWSCSLSLFSRGWGYQCCVGHLGITTMTFVLLFCPQNKVENPEEMFMF